MKNFKFIFYLFLINNIYSTIDTKKPSIFKKIVNTFIKKDFENVQKLNNFNEKIKTHTTFPNSTIKYNKKINLYINSFIENKFIIQNLIFKNLNKDEKFEDLFKHKKYLIINPIILYIYQQNELANIKKNLSEFNINKRIENDIKSLFGEENKIVERNKNTYLTESLIKEAEQRYPKLITQ